MSGSDEMEEKSSRKMECSPIEDSRWTKSVRRKMECSPHQLMDRGVLEVAHGQAGAKGAEVHRVAKEPYCDTYTYTEKA